MENDDLDINALIAKFEQMRYMEKKIYFDPDEFAVLADYYNDFGDISEADYIIETGLEMHPGSTQLMIIKAKILTSTQKFQEAYDYLLSIGEDDNNVEYLLVKIECLHFR